MEIPSWAYGAPPVNVLGDRFCFPYPMELIVKKKIKRLSDAQFDVFDTSGNLLLKAEGGVWNFMMKRILRDPAGFPVATMRGKAISIWHKWTAHEGQGSKQNKPLFSVKQSHPLQIKKDLNVYLADNLKKKVPDFHVTGTYTSSSFKVFRGHRLLAEVKRSYTLENFCKGKENYKVKVYPEVDYAFIVALLVALDENDTP